MSFWTVVLVMLVVVELLARRSVRRRGGKLFEDHLREWGAVFFGDRRAG